MADPMHILVTGGAGFIGSHLCERLLREGHRVTSLDNYFTGVRENHVDGVEYIEGHTKDISTLISETPDMLYHLGEYSRVEASVAEPGIVFNLNTTGTLAVFEFWREKKMKLVYAGSSTKFADGGIGRDQSPYAFSKAVNSELVRNYGEWYGLPYVICYFYNVYGPRERSGKYGTVIEIFRQKRLKGEPLTVTAPGTQRRNFTHVDDVVDALMILGKEGSGDEFGIGDERAYTILDIAGFFGGAVEMRPEAPGNRMSSKIDTSKTRLLGWSAKRSLEEYIRSSLQSKV
jgi:UDP-glucose 4-epimerase